MADTRVNVLRIAAKFFLPLQIKLRDPNRDCVVFSGFVVSVCHRWFWITAAHVLKEIESAYDDDMIECAWFGTISRNRPEHCEVEFNNQNWIRCDSQLDSADNPELSLTKHLDIGLVQLDHSVVLNLMSKGVEPLSDDELFISQSDIETQSTHSALFLIGVPAALKIGTGLNCNWSITAMMVEHVGCDENSSSIGIPLIRFKPDWGSGNFNSSVAGTSGGPILWFREDQPFALCVQNSEYRGSGNPKWIKGVLLQPILEWVKEEVGSQRGWALDKSGLNCPLESGG